MPRVAVPSSRPPGGSAAPAPVLPPPEDWPRFAPGPGSPVQRAYEDPRMLAAAGFALLLQVAHPTVGHGVHQHSAFTRDPWGRLLRTLDYVYGTVYGGPELAGSMGARLRTMHRPITGHLPDGRRYSALEPGAFAWVHATLAVGLFRGSERLGGPMSESDKAAFYAQWRDVGRLIGVRRRDLPEDYDGFEAYVARVIAEELERTPAVPAVLDLLCRPPAPDVPGVPPALWSVLRVPAAAGLRATTTGLLPPELRERLGLRFTRENALLFRAVAAGSRASGPLVRALLPDFGPRYVSWRFGGSSPEPRASRRMGTTISR